MCHNRHICAEWNKCGGSIDHAERVISVRGWTPFCLEITLEIPSKLPPCQMWTFGNKLCCLSGKLLFCNARNRCKEGDMCFVLLADPQTGI